MIDLEENLKLLKGLKKDLNGIYKALKIDDLKKEALDLENETKSNDFWANVEEANNICSSLKKLNRKIDSYNDIEKELDDLINLNNMLLGDLDNSLVKDVQSETDKLSKKIESLRMETYLSGKYDKNNAILTLHPGAGGTEAQDWVQMLYRMYTRWALSNEYNLKELDFLEGDEAGIKSVTFLVEGENAYGYLKGEMGVHRLVRISPFDSSKRRHTSFASVEVLPEIDDSVEVNINPDDLRVDTYRASGAGGQHVNKTSSAVRITHIPTGIVVTCQAERSQILNRETAMKMLKSKLVNLKEKENKDKIEDLKGDQKDIAWGSQIRSYVFCPYTMVKDNRTGYETGNVDAVMDGELNEFMEAYLIKMATDNS